MLRLYGVDSRPGVAGAARGLERLGPSGSAWQISPAYDDGVALLEATREQGLRGDRRQAPRLPVPPGARSADWVKVAHQRVQSCVVGGWRTEVDDARGWGPAARPPAEGMPTSRRRACATRGKAGCGLATGPRPICSPCSGRSRRRRRRSTRPCRAPTAIGARWIEPLVAVDVRYLGHTEGGRLRQPVVLGVRTDLEADDVRVE